MSLGDGDMSDRDAHRRELEAWEDRSIPGRDLCTADLMRRQEDDDRAARRERYEERRLCESEEAMAAYWAGVFRQMPDHIRRTHYGADCTS